MSDKLLIFDVVDHFTPFRYGRVMMVAITMIATNTTNTDETDIVGNLLNHPQLHRTGRIRRYDQLVRRVLFPRNLLVSDEYAL
jgi:hypothetical protein